MISAMALLVMKLAYLYVPLCHEGVPLHAALGIPQV